MENKRIIKPLINFIIMGILLVFPLFSFAYSDKTTHPALTSEIVKFFNIHYSDLELNDNEKEFIVQGSVDEDTFGRWMRHYYDPVYNRGITVVKKWQSSKEWSQDSKAQAGIIDSAFAGSLKAQFSGDDDYSWERSIYEYVWGDKERGLSGLGHILHLIEDATVPPHTRNDIHLKYLNEIVHDRSPYEYWASKFNIENIDVISRLGSEKPTELNTLDEYFDTVAGYTNNNFFSKDTIFHKDYNNPIISLINLENYKGVKYRFGLGRMGQRLVQIEESVDLENRKTIRNYIFDDNNHLIFTDYWNILSKQAVLNGAGVVKLFFDEVEKERETEVLKKKNRSWFQKAYDATAGKIFNTSKALYGSSVTYEDLQGAVIESQKKSEPEPKNVAENNIQESVSPPEPPARTVLAEEVEEMNISDEELATTTTTEKTPMEIYESKIFPKNTPFFGGGGGGVKTETIEVILENTQDNITPTFSVTLTECQKTLSISGCLIATTTLNFSWSSDSDNLDYYILDQDGAISTTTATSTTVTVSNNTTYTFSISAKDAVGNMSATSTQEIEIITSPVVINEVAWAGTEADIFDEWIELYNKSSKDIDLSEWVFMAEDGVPYIPLSGTISAGGYFLIERTDNNTVSDILADLIVPFSGIGSGSGLGNSGEHLSLVYVDQNATSTVDEVPLCNSSWCGGQTLNNYTMERYDPYASDWSTAIGEFILNGSDAEGNPIKGTPKAKNSISYKIANGTTLLSDKTLTQENSPYLVVRDGFTVNAGVTLTLEEGTVIKIVSPNNPQIIINGTLKTNGVSGNPVVITAFTDDSYGGDMNNDATSTTPTSGSWKNITINGSSSGSSLTNTIIRYGGMWFEGMSIRTMVFVDTADVNFQNVTIEHSKKHGLYITNSNSTIANSIFRNNNTDYDAIGLLIGAGATSVTNSIFENNNKGLSLSNAPLFYATGNTFTDNNDEAIISTNSIGTFQSNSGSGNGINAIVISGYLTESNSTTTLLSNQLSYLVQGDVSVLASSTLAFGGGVVVKVYDNNIRSSIGKIIVKSGGKLFYDGINSNNLIFTSIHDDSVGGVVDSVTTSPSAGDWYGIEVENGGMVDMSGFTLSYAGAKTSVSGNDKGGIKFAGGSSTSTIANALFDNNYQYGIRLEGGTNLIVNNTTFRNHTEQKVASSTAVWLFDSSIELQDIIFENNDLDIGAYGASTVSCLNCGTPTTNPIGLLP